MLGASALFALPAGSAVAAGTGSLTFRVAGLPVGERANATLRGPHRLMRNLSAARGVSGLAAGAYTLVVRPVRLHRAVGNAPPGSVAIASPATVRVHVRGGRETTLVANYGTIRSSRDHGLVKLPLQVLGPAAAPSGLVVAGNLRLPVGSIVSQAPSIKLPSGLFDVVTAVRSDARTTTLSLRPATLPEAFPQLDLKARIPLLRLPAKPASAHTASAAGAAFDLSLAKDLVDSVVSASCGLALPPKTWAVVPSFHVQPPVFSAEIRYGLFQPPAGKITTSLTSDAALDIKVPDKTHCDITATALQIGGFVPIGPFFIPVEAKLQVTASMATTADDHLTVAGSVTSTGGMSFIGPVSSPIVDVHPRFGPISFKGAGSLSMGPRIEAGLGGLNTNIHVGLSALLSSTGSTTGQCSLQLQFPVDVGADFRPLPFHPSVTTDPPPAFHLYDCPPLPGGGGGGTGGGGGGGPGGGGGGGAGGAGSPKEITAGAEHSCALMTGGQVDCWGQNSLGELGNGGTVSSGVPVTVSGITNATQISASGDDSCALLADGRVDCWGNNEAPGQLGNGSTAPISDTPVAVSGITSATQISTGGSHSCALLTGGQVRCWGANGVGELGNGGTTPSSIPVAVTGIANATQVSAGGSHSCALLTTGQIKCWGSNISGELGDGTTVTSTVPVPVSGITNATRISNNNQSCALLSDGQVDCWGNNLFWQLGNGSTANSSVPVPVTGISTATEISADFRQSCALLAVGQIACWGTSPLGSGDANSTVPITVYGITSATQISAGTSHSCALLLGGQIECWGYNRSGELGDGSTNFSSVPVAVHGIP